MRHSISLLLLPFLVLLAAWPGEGRAQDVHVALPDTLISADSIGTEVLIPLYVTDLPETGVASFEVGLTTTPSTATITGHETAGTLSEEAQVVDSNPECDQNGATFCLAAVFSTVDRLSETGVLVWLRVAIHTEGTTPLTFTYVEADEDLEEGWTDGHLEVVGGISTDDGPMQGHSKLSQPYPNPFSGETTLELRLAQREAVTAVAYDALGKAVRELYADTAAGTTRLSLDGSNLPTGVYVIRVKGESFVETRRVTHLR